MGRKTYLTEGAFIGLIIGLAMDIMIGFGYDQCQATQLQALLGITPICIKIYFLGIWLMIFGGIIGHYIPKEDYTNE